MTVKKRVPGSDPSRVLQLKLVKTIGDRLREAREICNMPQIEAAKRLGYSNPSKLSKVEKATDTNSVPLWLILRAAQIYEVSIDFLFGITDDWELSVQKCIERDIDNYIIASWEEKRLEDIQNIKKVKDEQKKLYEYIHLMFLEQDELQTALQRFRELNREFDDMRGGSRLVSAVERMQAATVLAKNKLSAFRDKCSASRITRLITANHTKQRPASKMDEPGPLLERMIHGSET